MHVTYVAVKVGSSSKYNTSGKGVRLKLTMCNTVPVKYYVLCMQILTNLVT